eukprot:1161676-Pelagomonas_calceolata.AAC.11
MRSAEPLLTDLDNALLRQCLVLTTVEGACSAMKGQGKVPDDASHLTEIRARHQITVIKDHLGPYGKSLFPWEHVTEKKGLTLLKRGVGRGPRRAWPAQPRNDHMHVEVALPEP